MFILINSISGNFGQLTKENVLKESIKIKVRKTGVNIDPTKLPDLNNPEVLSSHPNLSTN